MRKVLKLMASCLLGLVATAGAVNAQLPASFNTTGSTADHGTYGGELKFDLVTPGSSLKLRVTGWQVNQATNKITSAWVGAYSPGLGVTGVGDLSGASGYHQIDNAGGYTDFILLQFNTPVSLASLTINSFTMGSATTKDNDLAIYAANFPEAAWNSAIDLSTATLPSSWTTVSGTGADKIVYTGTTTLSRQWLVGAAFASGGNDAFKISGLTVTSPVPEPASWAMMIVGFGLVGLSLRSAKRRSDARFDAKIKRIAAGLES